MRKVQCEKAPQAIGPYSQAVIAGHFVYVSGQLPIDLKTGQLIADDIKQQTELVLSYIEAILASCGAGLENVVKTDVFLKDLGEFNQMNEVYAKKFTSDVKPARATIQAARLPRDARVEISCIALLDNT
jgi:2-iminobutanoate/2-iminopropanoate deaminase